jgi:predicted nucleic acid-binding protein
MTESKMKGNRVYLSPLSLHIYMYVYKKQVPWNEMALWCQRVGVVDFNSNISRLASSGPTHDFEDNVQLHSAVVAGTELFVTSDKLLLRLDTFANFRLISPQQI